MRALAIVALLALAACGARPARVAVRTPAHTVGDRVELSLECTRPKRTNCTMDGCVIQQAPTPCPAHVLTMRGDGGTVVETALPADGEVSVIVPGPGAPPRSWQVEADGSPLGTTRTHSYRWLVGTLDVLFVANLYLAGLSDSNEGDDAVDSFFNPDVAPYFWIGAASLYALGAPIAHAIHGNHRQAWWSLARRLAVPAIGAFMATRSIGDWEHESEIREERWVAAAALTLLSAPIWMAWDFYRAKVTTGLPLVTPTVSADGERAVLGFAGRF